MNTDGMFENSKVQIGDMIRVAPRVNAKIDYPTVTAKRVQKCSLLAQARLNNTELERVSSVLPIQPWPEIIIQSGREKQPVKVAWTKQSMPTIREFRNYVMRELDY